MKKTIIRFCGLLALIFIVLGMNSVFSQTGVLDPTDPVVTYNSANRPTQPPAGQIKDWVRTRRVSWNTDEYKCYIYQGLVFRIKFPKSYQHNVVDGKKYPIYVFFHGLGEKGTIYDNEIQLIHGGQGHMNAVNQDKFDGFLFYPQNEFGFFGPAQYSIIKTLIENYFVPQLKVDINRVIVDGLSGGGTATWDFCTTYPKLVAGMLPISAANTANASSSTFLNALKFIPIWHFQGGQDRNPTPAVAEAVGNALLNVGANYRYTIYPNGGHGIWNNAWSEADYYPFLNKAHKANPVALFGKYQFCEGESPNVTLGLSPGFDGYEWRKDGVLIAGATTNTYSVTSFGTYDCRIKRGDEWSPWSPSPFVVKLKDPTITPPIQPVQGQSSVIPSLASNTVTLILPEGFETYTWQKVGSGATIGTTNTLEVSTSGEYIARVTEKFGCLSVFSAPYVVSSSIGANKPDGVSKVTATTISKTSLKVDWIDNPHSTNNETAFEIYKATTSGGPYSLAGVAPANSNSILINGLEFGKKYYIVIRAINATAASVTSEEAEAKTFRDSLPPSAPTNFRTTNNNGNNVNIAWTASTDDIQVYKYDLYINDKKTYIINGNATSFTVYNLRQDIGNKMILIARDSIGNESAPSNLVFYYPNGAGLKYKYYHGNFSQLPDFNMQTPVGSGFRNTGVDISPRTQNDNFAFLWEGFINIVTAGTYTFQTNSYGGSKLWIGTYDASATPVVNNDGDHILQAAEGTITLQPGVYPISIGYFHNTGTEAITVSWKTPGASSFTVIPATSYLLNNYSQLPSAPINFGGIASANRKIQLNWEDINNGETGFEISRATTFNGTYTIVGSVPANITTFIDSINVMPETNYFYKIRTQTGYNQSIQVDNYLEASWKFDGNSNDAGALNRTLTLSGSPTYDASDKVTGTHSINFNGTSTQYATINNPSSFLQEAYSQRTISFWMKSGNNTGFRMVLDIGGNDDGIGLRILNSVLEAGIASNNVRKYISVPFTSSSWTHVTLVYNRNSFKMYLDGVEAAADNNLPFTALTTTSNGHRLAANNSSNVFNTTTGIFNFIGKIDEFRVFSSAIPALQINALVNGTYSISSLVRTISLPSLPVAPTSLSATSTGTNKVDIQWNDNATNEEIYEVYRSYNNASNFVLVKTVPAGTNQFSDEGLFANATYYYKVRAANSAGNSAYSNEISTNSLNNAPVFKVVPKQFMRFGTTLQVAIEATDADQGVLTLQATNLPSYATFTETGNGKGLITFSPPNGLLETFNSISIEATDNQSTITNISFDLEVNDNYIPDISVIDNINISEKQTAQFNITAIDQNPGDFLTWTFTGLPSFATTIVNGASVQVNLAPGYSDHGPYTVWTKIDDGHNGIDSVSFVINVLDVNPVSQKIYINFNDGGITIGAPWNSTGKQPSLNNNHPNLLDENGVATNIGFRITSNWQFLQPGSNNFGATTGNNSGVFPDNVMITAYWTNTTAQTIQFYGLDPARKFTFTFFGSRGNVSDNRITNYTINGETVSLQSAANKMNTVKMFNVVPAADGTVTLTIQNGTGSVYGYLNAMVIESSPDDGTIPAKPRNVDAQIVNGKSSITWLDAAYNESSYEVFRSETIDGTYDLLNAGSSNMNTESYLDVTILGSKSYYYKVRAVNSNGVSAFSEIVDLMTPNIAPMITGLSDIGMKSMQVRTINFTIQDPGDVVTLSSTGLPDFAILTNNNDGTGSLQLNAGSTLGIFENVTIRATDSKGASSDFTFTITVTDKDLTSVYVNFNQINLSLPSQWNSFNSSPYAGNTISGLKDDELNTTSIGVTLVDSWEGSNDLGAITGNDQGVFPDNAMKTAYFESSANLKRIRITGLSTSSTAKYNLVFFASRTAGDNRNTIYSAGGNSVTLNAANNTNNTVQINGLSADANGVIEFTAQKVTGSPYAYINALVIQSYEDNGNVISPSALKVSSKSKSSIELKWLDKSGNEDGFEIFRSIAPNGPYNLVHTTAPNITSFTNVGLQSNTLYYYKVRAVKDGIGSEYTNIEGVSTFTISVLINFNNTLNQSSPWNNTASSPEEGRTYSNLRNDINNSSGINMQVVPLFNFSAANDLGMNTGNNSGVVPDNVMRTSWWLDPGLTAKLKFSGLNQGWVYNFEFFGSRNGGGDRTTVYTINGRSVSLDAAFNTSQTVTLDKIKPNENGEVILTVSLGQYSQFAYLNALKIHAYEIADLSELDQIEELPNIVGKAAPSSTLIMETISVPNSVNTPDIQGIDQISNLKVYPNPVEDQISVSANFASNQDLISIRILDVSGRTMFAQNFNNVPSGNWNQRIQLGRYINKPGMYMLQIIGSDKKPKTYKLLKAK